MDGYKGFENPQPASSEGDAFDLDFTAAPKDYTIKKEGYGNEESDSEIIKKATIILKQAVEGKKVTPDEQKILDRYQMIMKSGFEGSAIH